MANRSYPNEVIAVIFRDMTLLTTRFDHASLLAMAIFLAYLLIPVWTG